MPKGSPTDRELARVKLLRKQLRNATSSGRVGAIKRMFRDYTKGVSSDVRESDEVKALRKEIDKRQRSLLSNTNRMKNQPKEFP